MSIHSKTYYYEVLTRVLNLSNNLYYGEELFLVIDFYLELYLLL